VEALVRAKRHAQREVEEAAAVNLMLSKQLELSKQLQLQLDIARGEELLRNRRELGQKHKLEKDRLRKELLLARSAAKKRRNQLTQPSPTSSQATQPQTQARSKRSASPPLVSLPSQVPQSGASLRTKCMFCGLTKAPKPRTHKTIAGPDGSNRLRLWAIEIEKLLAPRKYSREQLAAIINRFVSRQRLVLDSEQVERHLKHSTTLQYSYDLASFLRSHFTDDNARRTAVKQFLKPGKKNQESKLAWVPDELVVLAQKNYRDELQAYWSVTRTLHLQDVADLPRRKLDFVRRTLCLQLVTEEDGIDLWRPWVSACGVRAPVLPGQHRLEKQKKVYAEVLGVRHEAANMASSVDFAKGLCAHAMLHEREVRWYHDHGVAVHLNFMADKNRVFRTFACTTAAFRFIMPVESLSALGDTVSVQPKRRKVIGPNGQPVVQPSEVHPRALRTIDKRMASPTDLTIMTLYEGADNYECFRLSCAGLIKGVNDLVAKGTVELPLTSGANVNLPVQFSVSGDLLWQRGQLGLGGGVEPCPCCRISCS
jgi:hypothetical protein